MRNFPLLSAAVKIRRAARAGFPDDLKVIPHQFVSATTPHPPANRLDRLLLLLDTGSSASVRSTAAKQLAQLAVKSVITDVAFVEEDIKTVRQNVAFQDEQAWSELLAVLARVRLSFPSRSAPVEPTSADPPISSL